MIKIFNRIFSMLFAIVVVAMLAFAAPAIAADAVFCKSMTGTALGASLVTNYHYGAYVAIPGDRNAQVVVGSLSATSDNAAATCNLYVYDKENSATVNSASIAAQQEIGISSGGASFDANDIIVLQSPSGNTVYVETVASTG